MKALVVTTIGSDDNKCLRLLGKGAKEYNLLYVIAGDTKSPEKFSLDNCTYMSIEDQKKSFPSLAKLLPTKHYARKNMAYLLAIKMGAKEIQETDDDNYPLDERFYKQSTASAIEVRVARGSPWVNVYELFSSDKIWPRGLPLEYVNNAAIVTDEDVVIDSPLILQGLANGNPDVDAVYRMTQKLPFNFNDSKAVILNQGSWCPFNSQNTIFAKKVFPLLYLPSYCSFRMTDIWRSFVAQRCLWELGSGVIFHQATVLQERNEHSLIMDFQDEIPGYLQNEKIRRVLENISIDGNDIFQGLVKSYEALIKNEFILPNEYELVKEWCNELEKL